MAKCKDKNCHRQAGEMLYCRQHAQLRQKKKVAALNATWGLAHGATAERVLKEEPTFKDLGEKIGALVDEKNKAYGDSFAKAGDFLKLLYPNGISVERYGSMLCLVRIFDKQMRIATDKDAFGESPFGDITGYGLLGLKHFGSKK